MAKNKTDSLKQIFGIPTLNSLFQYILSNNPVRLSFFHVFLPNMVVTSSEPLDKHTRPVQDFQVLRHWLHNQQTKKRVKDIRKENQIIEVHTGDQAALYNKSSTKLFTEFLQHFEEISRAFPVAEYDGSLDFICRLDSGELALVEMQVRSQDFWDRRALALAALTFGSQLERGDEWGQIKRVIGINILGGGPDDRGHWQDTQDQYVRYYKFEEQLHQENPPRFLDGIEIIQYSLKNAPLADDSQEKQDWILFLKQAHMMTEEDVRKQIQTPAVRQAFDLAKIQNMPANVRDNYKKDELKYGNFSMLINSIVEEEKKKADVEIKKIEAEKKKADVEIKKIEKEKKEILAEKKIHEHRIVQYLKGKGESLSEIRKATGLSLNEIKAICEA